MLVISDVAVSACDVARRWPGTSGWLAIRIVRSVGFTESLCSAKSAIEESLGGWLAVTYS